MSRFPPLNECNCFALRQAARRITQIYERHLGEVGVTAAQFTILSKLANQSNVTVLDLSASMVMERTTLLRALKPMQRDGLVSTGTAEHDGRTHLLSLTKEGRTLFERASILRRAAQEEFERKFGKARAKGLRAVLFNLTG
jgi:DNA-binding MarR family transcriptional regulator